MNNIMHSRRVAEFMLKILVDTNLDYDIVISIKYHNNNNNTIKLNNTMMIRQCHTMTMSCMTMALS